MDNYLEYAHVVPKKVWIEDYSSNLSHIIKSDWPLIASPFNKNVSLSKKNLG